MGCFFGIEVKKTDERQQLLVEWNSTQADYPHVCVHELFEAQVERTPDAIALVAGSYATYRVLNQRANQSRVTQ